MDSYTRPTIEVLGTIAELTQQQRPGSDGRRKPGGRYYQGGLVADDVGSRDLDFP